jgi:hypothetical protein
MPPASNPQARPRLTDRTTGLMNAYCQPSLISLKTWPMSMDGSWRRPPPPESPSDGSESDEPSDGPSDEPEDPAPRCVWFTRNR